MALYTVASTGNLVFKDTGTTNQVSFFVAGTLASNALASNALGGGSGIVYYTPSRQITQVSSSGNLLIYPKSKPSNGLAGSSIGEFPLAGSTDDINQVNVVKAFVSGIIQSSGQLTISGSTTAIEAHQISSSGQLRLSGSSVYPSVRQYSSSGQLKLSTTSVYRSIRLEPSAGSLKLYGVDLTTLKVAEPSSGNLVFSGSSESKQVYNRAFEPGDITLNGSTVFQTTLTSNSTGSLVSSTYWYDTTHSGGLSTDPLASSAIASGTVSAIDQQKTTVTSFYGDNNSSGSLVISPTGEIVQDLSNSSGIAGSALGVNPLADGQDTLYRDTTYDIKLTANSTGQLSVIGSSGYGYTYDSSGQLVSNSQQPFITKSRSFLTDGNIVLNGNSDQISYRAEPSSGQLVTSDLGKTLGSASSIAGGALAELPISGGVDYAGQTVFSQIQNIISAGSIVLNGVDISVRTLDFLSAGGIVLTGDTVFNRTIAEPGNNGQINLTGSDVQRSYRVELSSGQLVTSGQGNTLGSSSSIAGSALAELPISGGVNYAGRVVFSQRQNILTSGGLTLTNADTFRIKIIETSTTGELTVSGSLVQRSIRHEATSGQLKLSGSDVQRSIRTERSSGTLTLTNSDTFRIKIIETSTTGQLKLAGTILQNSIRHEDTTGQTRLTGSSIGLRLLNNLTSGQLLVSDLGKTLGSASSIAGSALAELPISGGIDYAGRVVFSQRQNILTSGILTLANADTFRIKIIETSTTGQLAVSGVTVHHSIRHEATSGQTKLTGSDVQRSIRTERSSGTLTLTNADTFRIKIIETSTTGQLSISGGIEQRSIRHEATSGQLRLTGSDVQRSYRVELSSGQLVTSGQGNTLGSSSSIAGGALASLPISGGIDYSGRVVFSQRQNILTSGSLTLTNADTIRIKIIETSTTGRLTVSGSLVQRSIRHEATSGQLKLIGSASKANGEHSRTSSGHLVTTPIGYNQTLTNSASIAGSSLAELPLSGTLYNPVSAVQVSYISKGIYYDGKTGNNANVSAGKLVATGSSSISLVHITHTSGNTITVGSSTTNTVRRKQSAGSLITNGTTQVNVVHAEQTIGNLVTTGSRAHNVAKAVDSTGNIHTNGASVIEKLGQGERTSHGALLVSGSQDISALYNAGETHGDTSITASSKYNIVSIISSIGSVGVIGGIEEATGTGERTSGRVKLSGHTNIVISMKPGSRGFTRLRGDSVVMTSLNKEHMGGSGIYYGPWGAPFVLPFAKEYEEVNGKRRRKLNRLQVAIRFSRGDRWTRTHYDLNKMNRGVAVAASTPKQVDAISASTLSTNTKPKITVNASAFKLIQTHTPNVDLTNFNVVESTPITVQDFVEKNTLVETGSIKPNNYSINATVEVDTTSFKVTVALPKSTVDA